MISIEALEAFREAVGPTNVRSEQVVAELDPGWHPDNLAAGIVVAPATTAEVADVVRICRRWAIGVVPQGGRTGLVGGAVSSRGQIVLSSARLGRIVEIDPVARTATVEAGVTLEALQQAALVHGLEPGIDVPSRGSATIGGMASTNAGGIMAFRHGVMRHQILGLEAVLADGSIFSDLTRVVKNSAGYDLKHLLIGSEGTLGIVTRLVLKLEVVVPVRVTAFFGLPAVAAALDLVRMGLEARPGALRAAEALWRSYYRLTAAANGFVDGSVDDGAPVFLLMEFGGSDERVLYADFEQLFERALERFPTMAGVIATSARQQRELWRLREDTDAIYRAFPAAPSFDVSLPLSAIETYVLRIREDLRALDSSVDPFVFGHLADGNLHIVLNRAGPLPSGHSVEVEAILYGGLQAVGGSFSAEHGIGTKRVLALQRYADPTKLRWMGELKQAFDRGDLLNSGKVLVGGETAMNHRATRLPAG